MLPPPPGVDGFWNWLGFVATVTLVVTFSQPKPLQTFLIQNGYQALSLIALGALLAAYLTRGPRRHRFLGPSAPRVGGCVDGPTCSEEPWGAPGALALRVG